MPFVQFLVQLCIGLRAVNLEIFADAIRASINEQTKIAKWGYSASRDDNKVVPLTVIGLVVLWLSRGKLRNFCGDLRARINEQTKIAKWGYSASRDDNKVVPLTVIDSVVLWLSTGKLRNFCGGHSCILKLRSGDTQLRGTTTKSLLVQSCFGFRRGNLEIFAETIRARINEQNKIAKWGYSASRDDNKVVPLTVIGSVVLWLSTRELRNFCGRHSASINEEFT
ncbi:hypothetical protein V1477_017440 [Vespula maculifrons]|uniref:Uncharacterized protein n=1 Tax=Vespula maculifrons TaxID=7453 RepID=A0ABD2B607_VESMC